MNIDDIKKLYKNSNLQLSLIRGKRRDYIAVDNYLSYKDFVPIPITAINSSISKSEIGIPIIDQANEIIGYLCFFKDEEIDIGSMSDERYTAYINEIERENFGYSYKFCHNYLLLRKAKYQDYFLNYSDSSPIWGGFYISTTNNLPITYQVNVSQLQAVPNLQFPTIYHQENIISSVIQPFAFERFLKLYHLLELIFDWDLVQQIKTLGDDLQGIGRLLASHQQDEDLILKAVLENHISDIASVEKKLNLILPDASSTPVNYIFDTGYRIFFGYSKESNPFSKRIDQFMELIRIGGFSESNARRTNLAPNSDAYRTLVIRTTVYWIYRIRCCIVHNRIGEYVLTNDDERFVVDFIEPLIKEVIIQVFKT